MLLSIIIWLFFINLNNYKVTLHYLHLFSITFGYFWLFHPRQFLVILSYFWLLKANSPYVIIGNYRLL